MAALLGGNGAGGEHPEGPENRYIVVQPPNIIGIANDRDRSIRDYAIFDPETMNTGIVRPEITANHFEFKPMMFQMLQTMETFYNGLLPPTRLMLDASAGGALLNKSYAEAYDLIESIAANSYQWPTSRINTTKKVAGVHELGDVSALTAQIASLTNMQHPNFSWSTQTGQSSNNPNRPINPNANAPPGFQQQQREQRPLNPTQSAPQERGDSLEAMMRAFMNKTETHIQNQGVALRNLENQVGQLATALSSRPNGALPSNTENPQKNGKEHTKAITLRSGNTLEAPEASKRSQKESDLVQEEVPTEQAKNQQENREVEISAEKSDADISVVPQQSHQQRRPPPPFPQRFQKQQQDKKFQKFLDVLKQLHINIPFVEALEQMPNYVKFMKDMLMKKRKFGEFETVALTRECSAALQSKLPPKLQDPGSFTIPCSIGGNIVGKLCVTWGQA
ncbi:hypothetical protein UlMin_036888 [Ulmus minor]